MESIYTIAGPSDGQRKARTCRGYNQHNERRQGGARSKYDMPTIWRMDTAARDAFVAHLIVSVLEVSVLSIAILDSGRMNFGKRAV
uniref:Uncharacterized protein n=1 Tax=Hyaloperonospora arabidopsidis (strain Emoy2) TaxID=559515 RepID=M4B2U4_HYAAE